MKTTITKTRIVKLPGTTNGIRVTRSEESSFATISLPDNCVVINYDTIRDLINALYATMYEMPDDNVDSYIENDNAAAERDDKF